MCLARSRPPDDLVAPFDALGVDSGSDICLYSSRGFEQLLMSTVVQIDFLSCCGSHCIEYRISPPILDT